MENASRALIMAGSILIGVLILSLFVYLFNTMGQYAAQAEEKRAQTQVNMFNANFFKYTGKITYVNGDGTEEVQDVTCTMHDIITVANFAKQSNESFGFEGRQDYSDESNYVQVDFKLPNGVNKTHLEDTINTEYVNLLRDHEYTYVKDESTGEVRYELKKYKCELEISPVTGRVNYVKFTKYP